MMIDSINFKDTRFTKVPADQTTGIFSIATIALGIKFVREQVQRTSNNSSSIVSSLFENIQFFYWEKIIYLNTSSQDDFASSIDDFFFSRRVFIRVELRISIFRSSEKSIGLEVFIRRQGQSNTSIQNSFRDLRREGILFNLISSGKEGIILFINLSNIIIKSWALGKVRIFYSKQSLLHIDQHQHRIDSKVVYKLWRYQHQQR